jgi:hypothetical protein
MAAKDMNKCGHPSCTCRASSGSRYCSVQCEAMEEIPDIDCRCNHPRCKGMLTSRASIPLG